MPFLFSETTLDYKVVMIQGQICCHINSPVVLATVPDFTVDQSGHLKKNDVEKLNQRIIKKKTIGRAFLPSYILAPINTVIVVEKYGLVANTAKYIDGVPVIAINPGY
jgi:hypothetical protein